jgi:hypothetical protein
MDRGNQYNIIIQQGDDCSWLFDLVIPAELGIVVGGGRARLAASYKDLTSLADPVVEFPSATDMLMTLPKAMTKQIKANCTPAQVPEQEEWAAMTPEQIAELQAEGELLWKVKPYVWDCEVTLTGGNNKSLLWGYALAPAEVTRV